MESIEHYKYELEYFHPWYEYINRYVGEFTDLKFLRITDMKKGKPVCGLPYGKVEYEFEDSTIYIDNQKLGDVINMGSFVSYYTKILISSVSKSHLDRFLKTCKDHCYKKPEKKIVVRVYRNGLWFRVSELPKRSINSIYLEGVKKEKILEDIDYFKNNKEDYEKFSVPYKRNYLLYGPPGTGKTSLIYAIASKYDMDVHVLAFNPSINDQTLIQAVSRIEKKSILLFEDIDSLFEIRQKKSNNNLVSFSCLLNILDGLSCKSGITIFITTNHIEKLDKALLRPGRVDLKLEITYATKKQMLDMVTDLLKDEVDNFNKIWKKIRNKQVTMAAFQKFLFHCFQYKKHIDEEINFLLEILETKKEVFSNMYA